MQLRKNSNNTPNNNNNNHLYNDYDNVNNINTIDNNDTDTQYINTKTMIIIILPVLNRRVTTFQL